MGVSVCVCCVVHACVQDVYACKSYTQHLREVPDYKCSFAECCVQDAKKKRHRDWAL